MKFTKLFTIFIALAFFTACGETATNTNINANRPNTNAPNTNAASSPAALNLSETERPQKIKDMMAERSEQDEAKPVGSSRVDLQACKLEYSIVSPK